MDEWEVASLTYQMNSSSTTTNEHLEKKSSTTSATNKCNGHNNNNNGSGENVIVKDASAPTPIQHNSYEDGIEDGDDAIAEEEQAGGEPSSSQQKQLKSINDYYDTNKIGFYQTLSLVLNAGLMIYAQGTFSK